MSECRHSFTLTQNISWGFFLCYTPPTHTGLSISTIMYRCLLGVLCAVRRPVTTLECILLKGSLPSLSSRTRARDQSSSLSLSAGKTLQQCHLLVTEPALELFLYALKREPQGWFRSNELVNSSLLCKLSVCNWVWSSSSPPPPPLSCYLHLLFLTPMIFRSSSTDTIHLNSGFPTCRVPYGLSTASFQQGSTACILKGCPSHLKVPVFIALTMSSSFFFSAVFPCIILRFDWETPAWCSQ